MKGKKFIIFTDLDGTLLDENYSIGEASPVLKELNRRNIPVIFCTAKTKAEQEAIRKELNVDHPFIVENGSAIFIPRNYFGEVKGKIIDGYEVIVLGVSSSEINERIDELRKVYRIKGYHNMSVEEVAKITGLDLSSAGKAKKRDFGETVVEAEEEALNELKKDFNVVRGGRFIQVFGKGADKGRAVKILTDLYKNYFSGEDITTVGIGNAENDEPMLRAVDIPFVVKNPDGGWVNLKINNLKKVDGIGPGGWAKAVKTFVLGGLNEG